MEQQSRKKMVPKAGNRVLDNPLTSSVWSPSPSENQAKQTGHICRGLRADHESHMIADSVYVVL